MKHQFHLTALVICLAIWLDFGQTLVVPPQALAQSELMQSNHENHQILHRVSTYLPNFVKNYKNEILLAMICEFHYS